MNTPIHIFIKRSEIMKEFELYVGKSKNCFKLKVERLLLMLFIIGDLIFIPIEVFNEDSVNDKIANIMVFILLIYFSIRFLYIINECILNNTIVKFYITTNDGEILDIQNYKIVYYDDNYTVYCKKDDYKHMSNMEIIYGEGFIENILYK